MNLQEFNAEGCTGRGKESDMYYRSKSFGPSGAFIEVLKEKHHTQIEVDAAKAWLRHNKNTTNVRIIYYTAQPTPIA